MWSSIRTTRSPHSERTRRCVSRSRWCTVHVQRMAMENVCSSISSRTALQVQGAQYDSENQRGVDDRYNLQHLYEGGAQFEALRETPPSHMCSHIHPAWRAGLHSLSSQACRFPFSVPPSRCPSARARSEPPRRSRSSLLVRACRALPRPGADGASSHGVPSQPFPMASMLTPGAATRLDVVGCLGQASPFVFELFVNERGPGGEPSNRPTARFHRFALAIPPQHHLIHSAAVH